MASADACATQLVFIYSRSDPCPPVSRSESRIWPKQGRDPTCGSERRKRTEPWEGNSFCGLGIGTRKKFHSHLKAHWNCLYNKGGTKGKLAVRSLDRVQNVAEPERIAIIYGFLMSSADDRQSKTASGLSLPLFFFSRSPWLFRSPQNSPFVFIIHGFN